ncbi:MAG: hypothetical protein ACI9ON_000376 [Limisphaerales bacterium]|jgi:hypothetical protein
MDGPWLNTELYSSTQLFFYLGGFFLWGAAYVVIIRNILRDRFVEVPIIAVCGNITWEFLWGFYFENDMGRLLTLFYIGGALLDTFILYSLFRYGYKQVSTEAVRAVLKPLIVLSLFSWTLLYLGFKNSGYDLPLGSNSAYIVNVVMSVLYMLFALHFAKIELFSITAGWLKGIGTAMIAVFVYITYTDNPFVQSIAIVCSVIDAIYMVVLYRRQRALKATGGVSYFDLDTGQPRMTQNESATDTASTEDIANTKS